jgi:predicted metalloprotease
MRWDRSHQSSDIDDRRGVGGRAGGFPILGALALGSRFGWKGILVALLLIGGLTYGTGMCDGLGGGGGDGQRGAVTPERTANGDELARFVGFVFDDVQSTWAKELPGYQKTRLTLFSGAVDSACGSATAAVGPFYCPLDRKVYIDLDFYDDLRERFGAAGDFAQAYVIAHEVGHHVQNLRGKLGGGEVHQIDTELQADCLAGAWARSAQARDLLEVGDIDEALNAAAAIGDDTIQRKTTGRVQPETWTHGSAKQRSRAFRTGLDRGVDGC